MPSKIPPDWKVVRLGDVAEVKKGTGFTSKKLVPGNVPVIAGGRKPAYYHNISNRNRRTITVSGSGAYAGFVAYHSDPIFATDCTTIQSSSEHSDILYIYHYLKHRQDDIYRRKNGSAQPHIYPRDLASLKIVLPPVDEQLKIANILDSINKATKTVEELRCKTVQLREVIFHKLLTYGFPNHHSEWKKMDHLGTIPINWQVVKLGDVAHIDFSSVDKKIKEGEVPIKLCNYQDVINFQYIRSGINFMFATASTKEYKKWKIRKGDVIFTKDAEIGKISFVEDNIPDLLLGYHLGRAIPKTRLISGSYLAISLQAAAAQSQFRRLQTGVTISGIKLDDCRSIRLPLPTVYEQNLIVEILEEIVDNTLKITNDVVKKQKQLYEALLDELLTRGLPIQSQAGI